MEKLAIFASGSGSNAERIIEYAKEHATYEVEVILSNKTDAYVHQRAQRLGVPSLSFNREQFNDPKYLTELLKEKEITWVILAGFLWKIPAHLVEAFPNRIINIHPALLPSYGGKGMYGHAVHQAVVDNKESKTGITIHFVNEHYDEGQIIFQASCPVLPTDTADDVAQKVHALEYRHFPVIIEKTIADAKI